MMCGCALIATDVGGHREFAIDGETALLTPVGDINNMAANVIRAISNDQLRFDLAADSKRNLERFNWESSAVKFIGALTNFRECADV
jgi:glycosyltransferase involved in cell wall biosynthesis